MGRAQVVAELPGTALAAELRWRDPGAWAGFVDGFEQVHTLDPSWPAPGAELVWDARPGGRGRVVERVSAHEPGRLLVTEVRDDELTAIQRLAFADLGHGADGPVARVALALEYRLVRRGPLLLVVDPLFVRRALRDSLRRTLDALAADLRG
ncbi:MAG: hypothetical protein JWQ48_1867 [Conexibacter sp.]|nr:hypothetical protein [Conexibacter sp.]